MGGLQALLDSAVETGAVPGAAALVGHGGEAEIASSGDVEVDSIFRIASITKPITAAAVMLGFPSDFSLPAAISVLFEKLPLFGSRAIGGTGTTAHIVPRSHSIGLLLTQRMMTGPTSIPFMRQFWSYAFGS